MAIRNFNKLIDIEFVGNDDSFRIVCPTSGRKPNAIVSGTMLPDDESQQINLRITNLYTSKVLSDYHTLKINVGYEGSQMCCLEGSIYNVYVEKPGPDKVVVVSCNNAAMSSWLNTTVTDLKYQKGKDNINTIIKKLSDTLGFATPYIDPDIEDKSLPCDLQFDGVCKDLMHKLRSIYSDINITVSDNRFIVLYKKHYNKIFNLTSISAPPQISGESVTITAPWIPEIRPGDLVNIKTANYVTSTKDDSQKIQSKENTISVIVSTISFSFSTVGTENSMSILGTLTQ